MTPETLVSTAEAVTLVGGGPVDAGDLDMALALAPVPVAADGGARALVEAGIEPAAVIGDFDSLDPQTRSQLPPDRLFALEEQDSTDFHKCLSRIRAPLTLAVGFAGGRMDHLLAVFNVMVRLPEHRCVILGGEDVCVLAPPHIDLDLPTGTAVSLFPMGAVTAQSKGLEWPLDGLAFAPDGQSGTSNRAVGPVTLTVDAPKMLLMVPRAHLPALIAGLAGAPRWP